MNLIRFFFAEKDGGIPKVNILLSVIFFSPCRWMTFGELSLWWKNCDYCKLNNTNLIDDDRCHWITFIYELREREKMDAAEYSKRIHTIQYRTVHCTPKTMSLHVSSSRRSIRFAKIKCVPSFGVYADVCVFACACTCVGRPGWDHYVYASFYVHYHFSLDWY